MIKHSIYIFACVNILFLAGCGIKPSAVDAPVGAQEDRFPRTYPAPDEG